MNPTIQPYQFNIIKEQVAVLLNTYTSVNDATTVKTVQALCVEKINGLFPEEHPAVTILLDKVMDRRLTRARAEKYLDELINGLKLAAELNDGGTKIYEDADNYTNNGLTLIKCNTLDGNRDIYIGPKDMEYQESFCKNPDSSVKTFTKTYEVLNIALSNSDAYVYLTLRQFQYEEVETVKVLKSLNYDIAVGKNYEFTFEYSNENIEDNIKSIFNNATLTKIVETDKQGLDQIQDSIN